MSNDRFIKFIPSEKAEWLLKNHPWAFLLLTLIANRARRLSGHIDGLKIGECHLGDYSAIGATRGQYREALKTLVRLNFIEIIETCRTRKKARTDQEQPKVKNTTTETTTIGTKVKYLNSVIWDLNLETDNHRNNHPTTTEQPPNNHEQERIRKNKKEKKENIIPIPISSIQRKENVHISDADHEALIKKYNLEDVNAFYEHLSEWKKGKTEKELGKKTDIARLNGWAINACREKMVKEKELEIKEKRLKTISQPEINKEKALKILSEYLIPKVLHIETLSKHIEFIVNGSPQAICIEYSTHGFEEQLMNAIHKTNCKKRVV